MTIPREHAISLAVPNKGRLAEASLKLLARAGMGIVTGAGRQLVASAWDGRVRILFVRANDIPEFVQDGVVDVGITGHDLVVENAKAVMELTDLGFGHCRLVVAVHERNPARSLADLPDDATVATSFPNATRSHFEKNGKKVRIVSVSGAAEAAPHIGVADVITDLTASGSTLTMNDLIEVDEVLTSTARLIANPAAMADAKRRAVIDELVFAVETVVAARGKRYLMMDVPVSALDEVRRLVPGIAGPTIMDLDGNPDMKAVHVVVDEEGIYQTMRKLQDLGARGILLVPIYRMVA
jgi:ATP phosphoribosyltransferase